MNEHAAPGEAGGMLSIPFQTLPGLRVHSFDKSVNMFYLVVPATADSLRFVPKAK